MSDALARRLQAAGISDPGVLAAISALPRAAFVPERLRAAADDDRPLPIGEGQTISQPYVVAYMTEHLGLTGAERVLDVGTGSGYQTAILALLSRDVFSIEILPGLAGRAAEILIDRLRLRNVHLRVGDGARGWPEAAPFDRILVTAAAPEVPRPLLEQLAPGGRLIAPVGATDDVQVLRVIEKAAGGALAAADLLPVRFVPLTRAC